MDPINSIDRLVFVLRQRLQERARLNGKLGASRRNVGPAAAAPSGMEGLAAVEGLDERQLRRALIQNILAEQFGPEMLNDANFQQVVDRVSDTIAGEPGSAALMDRAVKELRTAAR